MRCEAAGLRDRVGRERRWSPACRSRSPTRDDARKILRIVDAFEDNDDVQDVYSNFDISDELMEAVEA